MSLLRMCVTLAALVLAPLVAWAEDSPQDGTPDNASLFKQLDTNADGFVAPSEVPQDQQRLLRRLLRTADKDSDGKLSRDEFIAGLKVNREAPTESTAADPSRPSRPGPGSVDPAALFKRMDRNGDGKVTADEVPEERRARVKEMIERLDANGDGAVSREEFAKMANRLPGAAGRPERPTGSTPGKGPNADAVRQMLERFKEADKNGDGKLSKAEAPQRLQQNFDRVDTNSDGQLDAAELRAMAERFRAARGDGGSKGATRPEGRQRPGGVPTSPPAKS